MCMEQFMLCLMTHCHYWAYALKYAKETENTKGHSVSGLTHGSIFELAL